jgi:hypothetical protein
MAGFTDIFKDVFGASPTWDALDDETKAAFRDGAKEVFGRDFADVFFGPSPKMQCPYSDEQIERAFPGFDAFSEADKEMCREALANARNHSWPSPKKAGRGIGRKTEALRAAILEAFEGTGKPVTVRQMFYLLSVAGAVDKTEGGYRQAQRQLLHMRREQLIPYDWIADNTRWRHGGDTWDTLGDCLRHTARFYRANLWRDLPDYVEVWCEKDALAGVIQPVTQELRVDLMVARGYSSETFAYEAAEYMRDTGKTCHVYYVGDFDPSGWDASRALQTKLDDFGANCTFTRLAITPEQARGWNLPTRPTKETDTRARGFYDEFGEGTPSIELDALPPDTLRDLIRDAITQHLPDDAMAAMEREELAARETLGEIAHHYART